MFSRCQDENGREAGLLVVRDWPGRTRHYSLAAEARSYQQPVKTGLPSQRRDAAGTVVVVRPQFVGLVRVQTIGWNVWNVRVPRDAVLGKSLGYACAVVLKLGL